MTQSFIQIIELEIIKFLYIVKDSYFWLSETNVEGKKKANLNIEHNPTTICNMYDEEDDDDGNIMLNKSHSDLSQHWERVVHVITANSIWIKYMYNFSG